MFSGLFLPYLTGATNYFKATSSFPDELKLGDIMSAFKNNDPFNKENYCPVRYTSQIFENILFNQTDNCRKPYLLHLLTDFWTFTTLLYEYARKMKISFR